MRNDLPIIYLDSFANIDPHAYCAGGHGSGQDVTLCQFSQFQLTGGPGGQGLYERGGGGGGVLVNGAGPAGEREHGPTDGEGWGAGSGAGWAAPGIVLLEILV